MNSGNEINKTRKSLVKIICSGYKIGTLRVTMYNFLAHYCRFREENIITRYIPEDLRHPNSEFIMAWEDNKLIEIEKLADSELAYINSVIQKYEKYLNYFDIKENQEIDNEYLSFTKDFFNKIVEVNYGYGIISDKSCLDYYAVAFRESLESYQSKIKINYNIDVLNIGDRPILDIIKNISNQK